MISERARISPLLCGSNFQLETGSMVGTHEQLISYRIARRAQELSQCSYMYCLYDQVGELSVEDATSRVQARRPAICIPCCCERASPY